MKVQFDPDKVDRVLAPAERAERAPTFDFDPADIDRALSRPDTRQVVAEGAVHAQQFDADAYGHAKKLSTEIGVPPDVVARNPDQAKRSKLFQDLAQMDSKLADWFGQDPTRVTLARDQLDHLDQLLRFMRPKVAQVKDLVQGQMDDIHTFMDTPIDQALGERLLERAGAGGADIIANARYTVADRFIDAIGEGSLRDGIAKFREGAKVLEARGLPTLAAVGSKQANFWQGLLDIREEASRAHAEIDNRRGELSEGVGRNNPEYYLGLAADSSFVTLAAMASGGLAMGAELGAGTAAWVGAGTAGATTYAQAYQQARAEGHDPDIADATATAQAVVEVLGERFGLGSVFGEGKTLGTRAALTIAKESTGEAATTVGQTVSDALITGKEIDPLDLAQQTLDSAIVGGLMGGPEAVLGTFAKTEADIEREHKQAAERVNKILRSASGAAQLDALQTIAADMKLGDRSQEEMQSVVDHLAEGGGPTHVYVDAEQFRTLYQSASLDPQTQATELTGDPAAYPLALATGGDIAIPIGKYLAAVAKSPQAEQLQAHARLDKDHLSATEMAGLKPENILGDILGKGGTGPTKEQLKHEQEIHDDVHAQLVAAGVEDTTATRYAKLYGAVFRTLSQRSGVPAKDLWAKYSLRIGGANAEIDGRTLTQVDPESPEFREWFGDSKLVDETGKPQVLYHGTFADFTEFKPSEDGSYGPGIYLAKDPKTASFWAGDMEADGFDNEEGGSVMPVYVRLQNPASHEDVMALGVADKDIQRALIAKGYDGIVTDDEVVVFDPAAIKSVNNRGTYGRGTANIMEQAPPIGTPAFDAWFRDSKIVDAQGNPLVMFHGTLSDFDTFAKTMDIGFHFGNTKQANYVAQRLLPSGKNVGRYRRGDRGVGEGIGDNVVPVYLSVQNPLRMPDLEDWHPDQIAGVLKEQGVITEREYDALVKKIYDVNPNIKTDEGRSLPYQLVVDVIKAKGYDGIIYENEQEGTVGGFRRTPSGDSVIVFDQNQAKSVFNRGTFSRDSANILEQAARAADISTEQFQAWFGDSVVVDSEGAPLVVYRGEHGGGAKRGHLQTRSPSISFGSEEVATTYAEDPNDMNDVAEKPRVHPVYLSIQNPVIDNRDDPFMEMSRIVELLGQEEAEAVAIKYADAIEYTGNWQEDLSKEFRSVEEMMQKAPERIGELYLDAYRIFDDPELVAKFKAMGFDGAVHLGNGESAGEEEYKIFDVSQAKSIHNRGTFNPNSQNIFFQSPAVMQAASAENAFAIAAQKNFAKGRDLKLALQKEVLDAADGLDLAERNEANAQYLTKMVVSDAERALAASENAVGWYNEKVSKALATVALIHPEIMTDPMARFAFTWALAVTSNGLKVDKNFQLAEEAYTQWKATGKMGNKIGVGTAKNAINESLLLFDELAKKWGMEELERFMTSEGRVGDIQKATGISISGESMGAKVFGAAVLGPKIGNGFFANLYGHFGQLTMDRWLMRTWGRWTGTLIEINERLQKQKTQQLQDVIRLLDPASKKSLEGVIGSKLKITDASATAAAILDASTDPDTRTAMNAIGPLTDAQRAKLVEILGPERKGQERLTLGAEVRKLGNALSKYEDGQKEAPEGPKEREFIRQVFGRALEQLQATRPDLTMADLQAVLWYPEKRLYESAKKGDSDPNEAYNDDAAPDYANAAAALAKAKGVDPAEIARVTKEIDDVIAAGKLAAAAGRDPGAEGAGARPGPDAGDAAEGQPAGAASTDAAPPAGAAREEVTTPEFKAWFGDSKVVDANGQPLRVYHGTASIGGQVMESFDPAKRGASTHADSARMAFFFTPSPDQAYEFAFLATGRSGDMGYGSGAATVPVYLSLQNPLVVSAEDLRANNLGFEDAIQEAKDDGRDGVIFKDSQDNVSPPVLTVNGEGVDVDSRGMFLGETLPLYIEEGRPASMIPEMQQELDEAVAYFKDELAQSADDDERESWQMDVDTWTKIADAFRQDPASLDIDYGPVNDVYAVFNPEDIKSVNNAGTWSRETPKILFQSAPLHSALKAAVAKAPLKTGTAEQWKGWLDGALRRGEIKKAETDWLGVEQWLKSQGEKISREEFATFVAANEVRVAVDARTQAPDPSKRLPHLYTVEWLRTGGYAVFDEESQEVDGSWGETEPEAVNNYLEEDMTDLKFAEDWSTSGKRKNDAEILVTLPDVTDQIIDPHGHFNEPALVVHTRVNERTDADGKKVMLVEEIQSDWNQEGRRKGYIGASKLAGIKDKARALEDLSRAELEELLRTNDRNGEYDGISKEDALEILRTWQEDDPEGGDVGDFLRERARTDGVPDNPFKATEDWAMLGFKQAVIRAIDRGMDRIAWTTGEMQNERYDLSKQIDAIVYQVQPDDRVTFQVWKDGKEIMVKDNIPLKEAEDIVGKDMVSKMAAGEGTTDENGDDFKEISGDGLKIGGDGMKGFYDKILPKAIGKWAKPFGGKVSTTTLNGDAPTKYSSFDRSGTGLPGKPFGIMEFHRGSPATVVAEFDTRAEMEAALAKLRENDVADKYVVHSLDITPAMREAAQQGLPLFQGEQEPRGSIQIGNDRKIQINLFAGADLSTFLHESGHLFLEILGDLAESENATQRIKDDYAAVLEWFGVPHRAYIGVPQHEQFARGFEAYLREGKSPSKELTSVFGRFAAWLTSIYKSIKQLNVQLSPEIRGVFDRMVATDDEIEMAQVRQGYQPLDAKALGLTQKQAEAYAAMLIDATAEARQEVTQDLLEAMEAEKQAWWKEELDAITETVQAELEATPLYQTLSLLRRGVLPDGSKHPMGAVKLSKGALETEFGKAVLPKLKGMYWIESGTDTEIIALRMGWPSSTEMVLALMDAVPLDQAVKAEADRRMRARHPDPMVDGTLPDRAMEAVHSSKRVKLLQFELDLLAKLAGTEPPRARILKAVAAFQIDALKVSDIKPNDYLIAERKAARLALEKAASGNYAEAYQAKRAQALNAALYRAAVDAREYAKKAQAQALKMSTKKSRASMGLAGAPFLDALDAILGQYSFAKISGVEADRRAAVAASLAAQAAAGTLVIPPSVLAAVQLDLRTRWTDLTMAELRGVVDTLKQLEHQAREANKLRLGDIALERADVDLEMGDSVRNANRTLPEHNGDRTRGQKLREIWAQGRALMGTASDMARELDGFADGGAVWSHTVAIIRNAISEHLNPALREAADTLAATYTRHFSKAEIRALEKPRLIPGIGSKWSRARTLALALNWGNAENRAAILGQARNALTEAQVNTLLSTLTANDWAFVQDVWAQIDSYWPAASEVERRRSGLVPKKVEALPFSITTADGQTLTIRGGYYPLKSENDSVRSMSNETEDYYNQIRSGRTGMAKIAAGSMIERVGFGGATVRLDLGVAQTHIRDTLRIIHLTEPVNYVHHALQGPLFRDAINDTGLVEHARALELWLKDVSAGEIAPRVFHERFARAVRQNFTASVLTWKFSSALLQVTGLFQSGPVIGWGSILSGLRAYTRNPIKMTRYVTGASRYMAERGQTTTEAVQVVMDAEAGRIKAGHAAMIRWGYYMMGKVQQTVDITTWLAAEEKGMALFGNDVAKARAYADDAVARAQGSQEFADKTPLQRGTLSDGVRQNEYAKAATMLGGYMLAKGNAMYEITAKTNFKKPAQALNWAANMTSLFVIEAMIGAAIKGQLPDDDDDDGLLDDYVGYAAKEGVLGFIGSFPLTNQLATSLRGYDSGGVIASTLKLSSQITGQIADGKWKVALRRNIVKLGGVLSGMPSAQINKTLDAIDSENPSVIEYVNGPEKKDKSP